MHRSRIYETQWLDRMARDGITPSLRMELRESLAPCVTLREPFRWEEDSANRPEPSDIRDLVEWELVLASDHVHATLLTRAERRERWKESLPDLLQDFTVLLRDALNLQRELGDADEKGDRSYMHQPSISDHEQNRNFRDWTALIKLTRDAWLATAQIDHAQARQAAEGWWQIGYPVFKRLALFAAAQSDVISRQQALDWLLAEDCWWLWSQETTRESLRLLVSLARQLHEPEREKLESSILKGPPREMFRNDLEQDTWIKIVDREILLRLAKVEATGAVLSEPSRTKFNSLTQKYPDWQLAEDERDEFSVWLESGGIADLREPSPTPRRRRELVEWLREHHDSANFWQRDDWLDRCRNYFPTPAWALRTLAKENVWPIGRWREALQGWKEGGVIKRSWRYMGPVLCDAHDDFVQSLARDLGWWLQAVAQTFESQETLFLNLCLRILKMHYPNEDESSALNIDDLRIQSMTHPLGLATKALLLWWYRSSPEEGQKLPETLKPIFTELCKTDIEKNRHGRVVLAAHVVSLYQVDRDWTMEYLVPLFDWQRSEIEAHFAWAGFLWSPTLYRPFLSAIRESMLETANRYESLGREHAEQYTDFLTFVALDQANTFTTEELAEATKKLGPDGVERVAAALTRALEGAGAQRCEYWRHRLEPYFRSIWPQAKELISPAISEELARLCVAAGDAFPEALERLRAWLIPVRYPDFPISRLSEEGLCMKFPKDSLTFLGAIVGPDAEWLPRELQQCLDAIEETDRGLATDRRFRRLKELIEGQGLV